MQAGWATTCGGGWAPQVSGPTGANWPLISDGFGNTADGYGSDATVFAVPGHAGQFAYLTMMHTHDDATMLPGPDDAVIVVSNDGGQHFSTTPVLINQGTEAGVDRPFAVADPGATDGTFYVAWEDTTAGVVKFRRGSIATSGTVTLSTANEVAAPSSLVGNFTMAVEHGATNTVHFAYADKEMTHDDSACASADKDVTWYLGSTTTDGFTWSFGQNGFDSSTLPQCAQGQSTIGYGVSFRPELAFNQDLGILAVAYSKIGSHGNVAAVVRAFTGGGSAIEVDTKNTADDPFRIEFATTPPGAPAARFGVAYYACDASGDVSEWMNVSTSGSSWSSSSPFQASATSFALGTFNGDYAGMAATSTSHFWPTWIDGNDKAVAAVWTP